MPEASRDAFPLLLGPETRRVLLPPPPRPADLLLAGAAGGLMLGAAEVLLARAQGESVDELLSGLLIALPALLVTLLASLIGVVLRGRRGRLHASDVVVAAGTAVLAGSLASALATADGARVLAGILLGAPLCLLVAVPTARYLRQLEAAGRPIQGGPLLACAAVGVAGSEALIADWSTPILLLALVSALAAVGLVSTGRGRPARDVAWGRIVAALVAVAALVSYGPVLRTWIELDLTRPLPEAGPLSLVVVGLDAMPTAAPTGAGGRGPAAGLELLAADGVVYDEVDAADGVASLLRLPRGESLPAVLAERGYATAAMLRDPARQTPPGLLEIQAPPGRRHVLARMRGPSAAGLLAGLPRTVLAGLGLDTRYRSAEAVGGAAVHWLMRWRSDRGATPFLLMVDLAAPGDTESDREVRAGSGIERILDALLKLGVDDRTFLVVGSRTSSQPSGMRVRVRPPWRMDAAPRGVRVSERIHAEELTRALLASLAADAEEELPLPGTSPS